MRTASGPAPLGRCGVLAGLPACVRSWWTGSGWAVSFGRMSFGTSPSGCGVGWWPGERSLQQWGAVAAGCEAKTRKVTGHARTVAWVWGSEPPAFSIGHENPMWPGGSGFTVLFVDEPEELDEHGQHPAVSLMCMHCLLDEHPEVGRGLDIARGHGVADLDEDGEWVVGDLSRLESD
jgi:hypothetical protein